ncbi:MAG: class I tRNA ligase family protein [bacterium]|nr:class I tRNA ligase family protein [bacterium]
MLKNLKQFVLPEVEEKILAYWKTNQIFEKTLKSREKGEKFVFYEGPPYANGKPGIHHVLARVYKDIILRYKTMRGYNVPRRAGWDTHGLPIELEAEKQLGIKSKKEIEKFGLALFNQKARESIWVYKDEWEKITERIGYWLDLKNAYVTYENYYIESLWWILSEISKKGLLKRDYKVVPYCPRCQTVLASHELAQPGVYKRVKDPSIFVKFKIKNAKLKIHEYLLVWTTTPWTLPANVAVAVNTKFTYTKYSVKNSGTKGSKVEYYWSLNAPPPQDGYVIEAIEKISGKKLIGLQYEPLFVNSEFRIQNSEFFKVYGADFVSGEDGTGFVHIAPAYGVDDFNLIKSVVPDFSYKDIPITIDDDGKVLAGYPGEFKFVKSADNDIIADLESRGLMYKSEVQEHEYPFCWRCSAPLLYFARSAWFIEVSKLRAKLVAANKKIAWVPNHIQEGRFGEWIKEAKDWAISRQRFWGAPLPIWVCEKCEKEHVVQSLSDLDRLDYQKNTFFLLRHTEAEHILSGVIASGSVGKKVSLTKKGQKDAQELANQIKKKNPNIIYSSPYKRTLDLAKIISKSTGAKIIIDKRLEEINCGNFNGRQVDEYWKFFLEQKERFTEAPLGGENLTDVKNRMFNFVREINQKHQKENILIISHADPLWVLEGAMKNLTNEEIFSLDVIKLGELREVQLHNWPYNKDAQIDLHRPFIDEVVLRCKSCKGKMARIKEVADVWFDSGAMPFASAHYPFAIEKKFQKDNQLVKDDARLKLEAFPFPADFICEAIDQTRGWFYTLLAVSTLLGYKEPPYKNVICLGLINDKFGQKMSKSRGNVLDPWEVIQKYGVDAVRWYFYTVNPAGETKNFDEVDLKKVLNRVFNIVYNSYVFYDMYADKKSKVKSQKSALSALDLWILASLNKTIEQATAELQKYEVGNAAKAIEELIDNLSRWYIRRSRRRLQKPEDMADYEACSTTLGFVISEITKLMAPFAPFFSEALYLSLNIESRNLNLASKIPNSKFQIPNSVHLEDWPEVNKKFIDDKLIADMTWVRNIATLALAKRAEVGIKVRQPLASLKFRIQNSEFRISKELLQILKDEINIKEIIYDSKIKEEVELDTIITPVLREEGIVREFARLVQELRQKAEMQPKDKVELYIDTPEFAEILERSETELKKQVGAAKINFKRAEKLNIEIETKIEDHNLWVGLKKA